MSSWTEKFIALGGFKGVQKKAPLPPPPPTIQETEPERERERPRKVLKHKKKKLQKRERPTRKQYYEDDEECEEPSENEADEEEVEDEWEDYYEPRRKKMRAIHRVKVPLTADRRAPLKRVVKKGAGNDFLEYGKTFTKAFSRVPDDARPDILPHVRPPLRRGFQAFVKNLLTDPKVKNYLTDTEKAALFENGRIDLLRDLESKTCKSVRLRSSRNDDSHHVPHPRFPDGERETTTEDACETTSQRTSFHVRR